jgi:MFS family permease
MPTVLERVEERHIGRGRPRRSGAAALLIVWGAWLLLMVGANVPAPLYAVYAQRFGFSSVVLTLVFTTYAFVLVPALMLFGQLSDRFGRRLVIVAGLAGLAQAGGSGAGPLVGGALAQWAPDRLRLPYLVMLGATLAAALLVLATPEPAAATTRTWRVTRPGVPAEILVPFARLGLTAAALWATLALYLSVVPSYAAALLHTSNLALVAAVSALACAASCAAQLVAHRGIDGRTAQALGLSVLAAGLVLLVLAWPLSSLAVLLAGAVLAGAGHGIGFLYAQDELNRIAPPERRGEVTAAFITCIYVGVACAVIAVGLLDLRVSLEDGVGAVAAVLAVTALLTAAWQQRAV